MTRELLARPTRMRCCLLTTETVPIEQRPLHSRVADVDQQRAQSAGLTVTSPE